MMPANLALSAKELELVNNTDWILTKHAIIQKVFDLYGALLPELQQQLQRKLHCLPEVLQQQTPKISKGENYRQLPYVIADYPRHFTREDTIAIRMLFWWGHFFSINVQVAGKYKQAFEQRLLSNWERLYTGKYFIAVGDTPWEHHFEADNFQPVSDLSKESFATTMANAPFVKLAKKIPLTEWGEVATFLSGSFAEMSDWLCDQAPSR